MLRGGRCQALESFYEQHNPEKVAHVDVFLKKFRGKETHIAKALRKKYPEADLNNICDAATQLKKARKAN